MSDRVGDLLALAEEEDGHPHSRAFRRELAIIRYRMLRRLPAEQRRRLRSAGLPRTLKAKVDK